MIDNNYLFENVVINTLFIDFNSAIVLKCVEFNKLKLPKHFHFYTFVFYIYM